MAWVSVALLLVANATLNTLGRAHVSTLFNWGRATLGTMPFLWMARADGAEAAMMGIAAAALVFALAAVAFAGHFAFSLGRDDPRELCATTIQTLST